MYAESRLLVATCEDYDVMTSHVILWLCFFDCYATTVVK